MALEENISIFYICAFVGLRLTRDRLESSRGGMFVRWCRNGLE